ncbi:hypothetical protein MKW94_015795 [Papaver nudicaule]|uniref:Uncharacterized protein n=1 Tax=Papaver nudicaule TaxID=74823 RepID=A0AA41V6M5_PAPNU|nr:hypothetical protein [Papaver nudicaule]
MSTLEQTLDQSKMHLCFLLRYAKVESPKYKKFIKSLNDDNFSKVYFASTGRYLSKIFGTAPKGSIDNKLKPKDKGYETEELRPGLHEIGRKLDGYDDVAVLLTDKTKDEVPSKLREYEEFDFVKPGSSPMKTVRKSYSLRCVYSLTFVLYFDLVFEKDQVLPLPPFKCNEIVSQIKKLGMPVVLSDRNIKLTENFIVCEDDKRVTENATQILTLLREKLFKYCLVPRSCWSASTEETEYFPFDPPKSQQIMDLCIFI